MLSASLIATLLAGSSLLTPASAEPIHLPISRRTSARTINLNEEAFRLRQRYGKTNATTLPVRSSGTGRRAATVDIPLVDQENGLSNYMALLNIGTPPQALNVILDTGSSDLYVVADGCEGCSSDSPAFHPSASSSYNSAGGGQVSFSSGSVSLTGLTVADTVQMGGFTIQSQTLIQVQKASSTVSGISGSLGLGFQANALSKGLPFWQGLANGNQLPASEFSFFLARELPNGGLASDSGVFTLGGTNATLFTGEIDFVNMPSTEQEAFWLLSLTGLTLNGNNIAISSGANALAAIDTGTPLIGGPTADVQAFWAAVPNSAPSPTAQGFFNFPCNQQLSVSMSFGGQSWPIAAQDMSVTPEKSDSSRCIGAIFDLSAAPAITLGESNTKPGWAIGDAFLKNVYSVFRADPPSIGFAQLSSAATALDDPNAAPSSDGSASPNSSGSNTPTPGPPPPSGGASNSGNTVGSITPGSSGTSSGNTVGSNVSSTPNSAAPGVTTSGSAPSSSTSSPAQSDNSKKSAAVAMTASTLVSVVSTVIGGFLLHFA